VRGDLNASNGVNGVAAHWAGRLWGSKIAADAGHSLAKGGCKAGKKARGCRCSGR
jgi:hypothetical protein